MITLDLRFFTSFHRQITAANAAHFLRIIASIHTRNISVLRGSVVRGIFLCRRRYCHLCGQRLVHTSISIVSSADDIEIERRYGQHVLSKSVTAEPISAWWLHSRPSCHYVIERFGAYGIDVRSLPVGWPR